MAVEGRPEALPVLAAEHVVVDEDGQRDKHDDHEHRQHGVFAGQERPRALLDGLTDKPHSLVALVLAQDVERQQQREDQRHHARGDREVQNYQGRPPQKISPVV